MTAVAVMLAIGYNLPSLANASRSSTGTPTVAAGIQLKSSGLVGLTATNAVGLTYVDSAGNGWSNNFGNDVSLYEGRCVVTSGVPPTSGTVNTYQALSGSPAWGIVQGSTGTPSGVWTVDIRDISSSVVVASMTFTWNLTRT